MLGGVLCITQVSGNGTVYIIRHGEKTWALGCLDSKGHARARNIVNVFNGTAFGVPKYIFANWYDDPIDCERCNQTVTPISQALKINIDLTHGGDAPGRGPNGGNKAAAAAVLKALNATGGPVLVAWEHINIKTLTEDLGVSQSDIPKWSGSDYDSIYELQFDATQRLVSFSHSAENFTGTDASAVVV